MFWERVFCFGVIRVIYIYTYIYILVIGIVIVVFGIEVIQQFN